MLNGVAVAGVLEEKNILILGDSLSAAYGINPQSGWVNLLADKLAQEKIPYKVINASISGDTTINGLNRLPDLLNRHRPEIVVIELGANDGLRGVQLPVMQTNLEKMINYCQTSGAKVLLVGMRIPPNYGRRYTESFQKVYFDLADKYTISLVPFLLDGVGGQASLMQSDGLHPNAQAQPVILQTLWPKLELLL